MKPIFRTLSSKVTPTSPSTTFPSALYGITVDTQHNHFGHFPSSMSNNNSASFRRRNSQNAHHHHNHPPQHHVWRRRNCLWPYWSSVNQGGRIGSGNRCGSLNRNYKGNDCMTFIPASPVRCTNKSGFVTIPGVENVDPFLLSLRFYGFDLWMNRYAETGKRFSKRNFITKGLFYFALLSINLQMLLSVITSASDFVDGKKTFYSSLDDVRTFILKFTMTFAVDFWYFR